jgi:hypothetical protein
MGVVLYSDSCGPSRKPNSEGAQRLGSLYFGKGEEWELLIRSLSVRTQCDYGFILPVADSREQRAR